MDLVLEVIFASVNRSGHVHHNLDPVNPVRGQIDLIGPCRQSGRRLAVKKIIDNLARRRPYKIGKSIPTMVQS